MSLEGTLFMAALLFSWWMARTDVVGMMDKMDVAGLRVFRAALFSAIFFILLWIAA